jgi:transcriptional regulator GlxA family with amidase domain
LFRRLFFCHLGILLAIHRHRCGDPATGAWRVGSMLELAHKQNGSVRIAIQPLAESLHVSENYLGGLFQSRTGIGFREYLRLLRIRRASELLGRTSLGLSVIAETLGHSSVANFAREIRVELGVPPRVLRQVFGPRNGHPSAGGG